MLKSIDYRPASLDTITESSVEINFSDVGLVLFSDLVGLSLKCPAKLSVLNQLRLPYVSQYINVKNTGDAFYVIRRMQVRGAPAISIVAILALAVELMNMKVADYPDQVDSYNDKVDTYDNLCTSIDQTTESLKRRGPLATFLKSELNLNNADQTYMSSVIIEFQDAILAELDNLLGSRPTAVNLYDAVTKLQREIKNAVSECLGRTQDKSTSTSLPERNGLENSLDIVCKLREGSRLIVQRVIQFAEKMLQDDIETNRKIGLLGSEWIVQHLNVSDSNTIEHPPGLEPLVDVITHCNTGSLATAGHGTALGIIRDLHARHKLRNVYYTETRPYNQGSRLTGYELSHDNIPATLITDSMVGALLQKLVRERQCNTSRPLRAAVDQINRTNIFIIVGADRIAANGDTANKIGTYSLSCLAQCHKPYVKFIVAAPHTTIDTRIPNGDSIVIEERSASEITHVSGELVPNKSSKPGTNVLGTHLNYSNVELATVRIAANGVNVWNPSFDVTPAQYIDAIVSESQVFEANEGFNFTTA